MAKKKGSGLAAILSGQPVVVKKRKSFKERFKEKLISIGPHLGLVVANVVYVIAGAYVFVALEGPHEETTRKETERFVLNEQTKLIDGAVEARIKYIDDDESYNVTLNMLFDSYTEAILLLFFDPVKANYFDSRVYYNNTYQRLWTESAALLFTSTTVIPVGFGLVTPMTGSGRAFLCTYAALGLPLALITLSDIGKFLSNLGYDLVKKESTYSLTLLILLPVYPIMWGIMISLFTNNSMIDSIYYCSITIFTIGYGDMGPPVPIPILLCFIIFGVTLVTLTIDVVAANAIDRVHYVGRQMGKARVIADKMIAMAQKININRGLELGFAQLNTFAKLGILMKFDGNGVTMPQMVMGEPLTPNTIRKGRTAFDPPGFMPFADEKAYRHLDSSAASSPRFNHRDHDFPFIDTKS
ncbi:unnamed protein product, partial [Mesorhabditis belari]|uniref:Potassium channel domain-containing protein n=1 Tax=Mesorhabditis belari TaxID=2138241 RepID=A0AAF3EWX7_9BILA